MSDAELIQNAHESGELKDKIQEVMAYISIAGSVLFGLITIPAMPIIFYMTMLFNVIMLVIEYFREL